MRSTIVPLLAALLVAGACQRDDLTSPAALPPELPLLLVASADEVNVYVNVVDDIAKRLLPSLSDQGFAAHLATQLTKLTSAMMNRDTQGARAALTSTLTLVEAYVGAAGADAQDNADLYALLLNLYAADWMIGS